MLIELLSNPEITHKIADFEELGGVVDFKFFNVISESDTYSAHLEVAKQTMIEIAKDYEYIKINISFDILEKSGIAINSKGFTKYSECDFTNPNSHFCYAVLYPPYSFRAYDKKKYFEEFCEFLFSDIEKTEIYQWSTDCSNFFDCGKEWWGTFFWTVYNPIKDFYIGIVASTTD